MNILSKHDCQEKNDFGFQFLRCKRLIKLHIEDQSFWGVEAESPVGEVGVFKWRLGL